MRRHRLVTAPERSCGVILLFARLGLSMQFRRVANLFFLAISIIQLSTDFSPTSKFSTILPLAIVLGVSLAKEAWEDLKRHQADDRTNAASATVLQSTGDRVDEGIRAAFRRHCGRAICCVRRRRAVAPLSSTHASEHTPTMQGRSEDAHAACWAVHRWASLRAGDVVLLRDGDASPADLLLLSCSAAPNGDAAFPPGDGGLSAGSSADGAPHPPGRVCRGTSDAAAPSYTAYVETSSLDGESNLKARFPLIPTAACGCSPHQLSLLRGALLCEPPNARLYNFEGQLWVRMRPAVAAEDGAATRLGEMPGSGRAGLGVPASAHSEGTPDGTSSRPPPPGCSRVQVVPCSSQNMLLRGMTLKNTPWAVGLVVWAGKDTKLMHNARATPSKRSQLDALVDRVVLGLFAALFVLCCVTSALSLRWLAVSAPGAWYIGSLAQTGATIAAAQASEHLSDVVSVLLQHFGEMFLTSLVLYNGIVPISLYVTLELVKFGQARHMDSDAAMRHTVRPVGAAAVSAADPASGVLLPGPTESSGLVHLSARCRTSNLNESLGQVGYIFSDKTGTLTSNELVAKVLSVGDSVYKLAFADPSSSSPMRGRHQPLHPRRGSHPAVGHHSGVAVAGCAASSHSSSSMEAAACAAVAQLSGSLKDQALLKTLTDVAASNHLQLWECLLCLALCHSVMPFAGSPATSHAAPSAAGATTGALVYQAASPDEGALVAAARSMGCELIARDNTSITLRILGVKTVLAVLAVNEFTSARRRMSVLVRRADGSAVLYCKGADSAMLPRIGNAAPLMLEPVPPVLHLNASALLRARSRSGDRGGTAAPLQGQRDREDGSESRASRGSVLAAAHVHELRIRPDPVAANRGLNTSPAMLLARTLSPHFVSHAHASDASGPFQTQVGTVVLLSGGQPQLSVRSPKPPMEAVEARPESECSVPDVDSLEPSQLRRHLRAQAPESAPASDIEAMRSGSDLLSSGVSLTSQPRREAAHSASDIADSLVPSILYSNFRPGIPSPDGSPALGGIGVTAAAHRRWPGDIHASVDSGSSAMVEGDRQSSAYLAGTQYPAPQSLGAEVLSLGAPAVAASAVPGGAASGAPSRRMYTIEEEGPGMSSHGSRNSFTGPEAEPAGSVASISASGDVQHSPTSVDSESIVGGGRASSNLPLGDQATAVSALSDSSPRQTSTGTDILTTGRSLRSDSGRVEQQQLSATASIAQTAAAGAQHAGAGYSVVAHRALGRRAAPVRSSAFFRSHVSEEAEAASTESNILSPFWRATTDAATSGAAESAEVAEPEPSEPTVSPTNTPAPTASASTSTLAAFTARGPANTRSPRGALAAVTVSRSSDSSSPSAATEDSPRGHSAETGGAGAPVAPLPAENAYLPPLVRATSGDKRRGSSASSNHAARDPFLQVASHHSEDSPLVTMDRSPVAHQPRPLSASNRRVPAPAQLPAAAALIQAPMRLSSDGSSHVAPVGSIHGHHTPFGDAHIYAAPPSDSGGYSVTQQGGLSGEESIAVLGSMMDGAHGAVVRTGLRAQYAVLRGFPGPAGPTVTGSPMSVTSAISASTEPMQATDVAESAARFLAAGSLPNSHSSTPPTAAHGLSLSIRLPPAASAVAQQQRASMAEGQAAAQGGRDSIPAGGDRGTPSAGSGAGSQMFGTRKASNFATNGTAQVLTSHAASSRKADAEGPRLDASGNLATHAAASARASHQHGAATRELGSQALPPRKGPHAARGHTRASSAAEGYRIAALQRHLDSFGSSGLRTLVLARRHVDERTAARLLHQHAQASMRVQGREAALMRVADEMEQDLQLLGATGIEDRLQEDTAGTIAALVSAGIRVWMLTGDKAETAISIGLSARLVEDDVEMVVLRSSDLRANVHVLAAAKKTLQDSGMWRPGQVNANLALVIEGTALVDLLPADGDAASSANARERQRRPHRSAEPPERYTGAVVGSAPQQAAVAHSADGNKPSGVSGERHFALLASFQHGAATSGTVAGQSAGGRGAVGHRSSADTAEGSPPLTSVTGLSPVPEGHTEATDTLTGTPLLTPMQSPTVVGGDRGPGGSPWKRARGHTTRTGILTETAYAVPTEGTAGSRPVGAGSALMLTQALDGGDRATFSEGSLRYAGDGVAAGHHRSSAATRDRRHRSSRCESGDVLAGVNLLPLLFDADEIARGRQHVDGGEGLAKDVHLQPRRSRLDGVPADAYEDTDSGIPVTPYSPTSPLTDGQAPGQTAGHTGAPSTKDACSPTPAMDSGSAPRHVGGARNDATHRASSWEVPPSDDAHVGRGLQTNNSRQGRVGGWLAGVLGGRQRRGSAANELPGEAPHRSAADGSTLRSQSTVDGSEASERLASTLTVAEAAEARQLLLELATQCRAVIACRMSPLQKAQLVQLVRSDPTVQQRTVTLAIGDGANDVPMLQEADVGVGIQGREGTQAVNAADFALPRFKHLQRLVLVHGRLNYRRVCLVILYSLYKNALPVLVLFMFTFVNGFSGTTLFESYLGAAWNVLFTSLPILVVGVWDRDVSDPLALTFPVIYGPGQRNSGFNAGKVVAWLTLAAFHALAAALVCSFTLLAFTGASEQLGLELGLIPQGAMMHFMLVLVANAALAAETFAWTTRRALVFGASVALWVLFLSAYSGLAELLPALLLASSTSLTDILGVAAMTLWRPQLWVVIPLVLTVCLLPHLAWLALRRSAFPTVTMLVQEWSAGYGTRSAFETAKAAAAATTAASFSAASAGALSGASAAHFSDHFVHSNEGAPAVPQATTAILPRVASMRAHRVASLSPEAGAVALTQAGDLALTRPKLPLGFSGLQRYKSMLTLFAQPTPLPSPGVSPVASPGSPLASPQAAIPRISLPEHTHELQSLTKLTTAVRAAIVRREQKLQLILQRQRSKHASAHAAGESGTLARPVPSPSQPAGAGGVSIVVRVGGVGAVPPAGAASGSFSHPWSPPHQGVNSASSPRLMSPTDRAVSIPILSTSPHQSCGGAFTAGPSGGAWGRPVAADHHADNNSQAAVQPTQGAVSAAPPASQVPLLQRGISLASLFRRGKVTSAVTSPSNDPAHTMPQGGELQLSARSGAVSARAPAIASPLATLLQRYGSGSPVSAHKALRVAQRARPGLPSHEDLLQLFTQALPAAGGAMDAGDGARKAPALHPLSEESASHEDLDQTAGATGQPAQRAVVLEGLADAAVAPSFDGYASDAHGFGGAAASASSRAPPAWTAPRFSRAVSSGMGGDVEDLDQLAAYVLQESALGYRGEAGAGSAALHDSSSGAIERPGSSLEYGAGGSLASVPAALVTHPAASAWELGASAARQRILPLPGAGEPPMNVDAGALRPWPSSGVLSARAAFLNYGHGSSLSLHGHEEAGSHLSEAPPAALHPVLAGQPVRAAPALQLALRPSQGRGVAQERGLGAYRSAGGNAGVMPRRRLGAIPEGPSPSVGSPLETLQRVSIVDSAASGVGGTSSVSPVHSSPAVASPGTSPGTSPASGATSSGSVPVPPASHLGAMSGSGSARASDPATAGPDSGREGSVSARAAAGLRFTSSWRAWMRFLTGGAAAGAAASVVSPHEGASGGGGATFSPGSSTVFSPTASGTALSPSQPVLHPSAVASLLSPSSVGSGVLPPSHTLQPPAAASPLGHATLSPSQLAIQNPTLRASPDGAHSRMPDANAPLLPAAAAAPLALASVGLLSNPDTRGHAQSVWQRLRAEASSWLLAGPAASQTEWASLTRRDAASSVPGAAPGAVGVGGDEDVMTRAESAVAAENTDALLRHESAAPLQFNRCTHRFDGDPQAEQKFSVVFVRRATRLTRLAAVGATLFAAIYIAESAPESTTVAIGIRCLLVALGVAVVASTYTSLFRKHYNILMTVVLIAVGLGKTMAIDSAGQFGQALFPLSVLVLLRIPFLNAIAICAVDLLIYVVFTLTRSGAATYSLPSFALYLAFVLGFAGAGSYSLNKAMRSDYVEQSRLYQEERRGADLLNNMLPAHVVKLLRSVRGRYRGIISFAEPSISLIFVDIANWYDLVASHSAQTLVQVLDGFYGLLDVLAEKHAIHKYETVGRSWVGCSGLNRDRPDHTAALALFGLDVLRHASQLKTLTGGPVLIVRIGLHTGPAVTGVVGRTRPQFCIVGATINTASRMCSSGVDGHINVSPAAHAALDGRFVMQAREVIVKSIGPMTCYLVLGVVKASASKDARAKGRDSSGQAKGSHHRRRSHHGAHGGHLGDEARHHDQGEDHRHQGHHRRSASDLPPSDEHHHHHHHHHGSYADNHREHVTSHGDDAAAPRAHRRSRSEGVLPFNGSSASIPASALYAARVARMGAPAAAPVAAPVSSAALHSAPPAAAASAAAPAPVPNLTEAADPSPAAASSALALRIARPAGSATGATAKRGAPGAQGALQEQALIAAMTSSDSGTGYQQGAVQAALPGASHNGWTPGVSPGALSAVVGSGLRHTVAPAPLPGSSEGSAAHSSQPSSLSAPEPHAAAGAGFGVLLAAHAIDLQPPSAMLRSLPTHEVYDAMGVATPLPGEGAAATSGLALGQPFGAGAALPLPESAALAAALGSAEGESGDSTGEPGAPVALGQVGGDLRRSASAAKRTPAEKRVSISEAPASARSIAPSSLPIPGLQAITGLSEQGEATTETALPTSQREAQAVAEHAPGAAQLAGPGPMTRHTDGNVLTLFDAVSVQEVSTSRSPAAIAASSRSAADTGRTLAGHPHGSASSIGSALPAPVGRDDGSALSLIAGRLREGDDSSSHLPTVREDLNAQSNSAASGVWPTTQGGSGISGVNETSSSLVLTQIQRRYAPSQASICAPAEPPARVAATASQALSQVPPSESQPRWQPAPRSDWMLPAPAVLVPALGPAAGASASAALAAAHPVMAAGLAGRVEDEAADDHHGQSRAGAARGHVQELEMYARAALLMRILQRQEGERTRILARVLRRSRDVALRFCTYAFRKAELERRWVAAYISPSTLGRVRAVLAVLALFHVFRLAESLFERQVLTGRVGSGMHPSPREWGGRLLALSLLGSFLVLSYTSWYAEAGGEGHDGDTAASAVTSAAGEARSRRSRLSATISPAGYELGSGASAGHGFSGVHDVAGTAAFPPRQHAHGGMPLSPSSARGRSGLYQSVRPQEGGIADAADAAAAAEAASAARLPMSSPDGDGDADGDETLSPIVDAAGRTTGSPELAPRTWHRTPSGPGHLSGSLSPRSFGGLPETAGDRPWSPVAAAPPTSLPGSVAQRCRRLYRRWQVAAWPLRFRLAVRRHGHEVVLLCAGCLLALSGSQASVVCLDFIFFLALVSNGGAVPFLRALLINSAAVLCCIMYGFASSDFQPVATGIPGSAFEAWDLFFLAASFLMVLVASAATEYYLRHRFGVAQLTADEVARNNALVYRMLPVSIAKELMRSEGRQYISQSFSGVTLLFSDIQGFTAMSASVAPEQVISMLNRLFAAFDALTELHGTFKLMTIGDAYVSVAGVPYAEAPSSDQRWVRPAEDGARGPEGSPLDGRTSAAASRAWRRAESPGGGRGRASSVAEAKSQTGDAGELAEEGGGLHSWLPRLRASFGDLQDKLAAGTSPHSRPARAGASGLLTAAASPTARSAAGQSGGGRALSPLNRRGHSAALGDKSPVHSPVATPTGELSPPATPGSPVAPGGAADAVAAFHRSGGRSLAAVGIKHPVEWLDEENERLARRAARRLGSSGTRSFGRAMSSRVLPGPLMPQQSGAASAATRVPASPAHASPLLSAGGGSVTGAEHASSAPEEGVDRVNNSHVDTYATTQATEASSLNGATGLMPTLASLETEAGGRQEGQGNTGSASFLRLQGAGDEEQPFWHDGNAATMVTEAATSAGASFAELRVSGGAAVSDAPAVVDITDAPGHPAARPQLTLPGSPAVVALSQAQHASGPGADGLASLQTPLPQSLLGSLHRRWASPGGGSASAASTGMIEGSRSFAIPGTQDHRAFDVSLASLVSPADYTVEGFEDAPSLAGMRRSGPASRLSPGSAQAASFREGGNPSEDQLRMRGAFPHPAQLDTEGSFGGSVVRSCLGFEGLGPVALPGEVASTSIADIEPTTNPHLCVGSGLARATLLRSCSPGDARAEQPTAAHVSASQAANAVEDLRSGGPLVTEIVAARRLQSDTVLLARNLWQPHAQQAALASPVAAAAALGDAASTVTEYPMLAEKNVTNCSGPQQLLDGQRSNNQLPPIPEPTPSAGGSEDVSRRFFPMSLAATPSHQEHPDDRPSGSLLLQAVSVLRRESSGEERQPAGAAPASRLAAQADIASLPALHSSQSLLSAAPANASHSNGAPGIAESATLAAVKTGSEPAVHFVRTGASTPAVTIPPLQPVDIVSNGADESAKLPIAGARASATPLLASRPGGASPPQPLPDHTYVRPEPFPALDWPVLHPEAAELVDPVAIHAARMLRMAVDMTDCVRRIRSPLTGEPIKMRLGLHTGNIHGGVIGTKTLRYDVFGPDVLAANNMESSGVAGGIVVSESTMRALVSLRGTQWAIPGLTFLPHGTVAVKGLGPVDAYVVQVEGVPLADGTDGAPQHG